MSGRSSRLGSTLALVALVAACGTKGDAPAKKRVKGKPERVQVLAKFMVDNVPRPGVVPECKDEDFLGGYPITQLSLLLLGKALFDKEHPERQTWMNPPELEAPSVAVLLDDKASSEDKAYAAGEFVNAPFFVVYRVENADAPLALGVKELKIGTVSTKIIKYGKDTIPICAKAFSYQNSKEKSDWAIEKSDKALVDPAIAQAMRDDLTARWIELAPKVKAAPPTKK